MKPPVAMAINLISLAIILAGGVFLVGCSLHRPTPRTQREGIDANSTTRGFDRLALGGTSSAGDDKADVIRVGGDLNVQTTFSNGEYSSGRCQITTPLPEGYPAPSPPDAIELKFYPMVRRAGIGGTMAPDWGMNFAFFPLFNHIKRREIAMTSPVEMNYYGLGAPEAVKPESWIMSFVYRKPELGPDGVDAKDSRILVEDIPPMIVVAVGMRGPYKLSLVNRGIARLRDWLSNNSEWEEADDPRALFYNGPEMDSRDKWSEVQIPVRRRSPVATR